MALRYGKVPFLSYYAVNNGIKMVVVVAFYQGEKLTGATLGEVLRDLNWAKKYLFLL